MRTLWQQCIRALRHRWVGMAHPPLSADALQRLATCVAASEQQHTGQIRVCVENSLPPSYLWRGASARDRALTLFGKLRVWDTEHNNGVLIYLLRAEHAIEIVADRGVARCVDAAEWQAIVARMAPGLRQSAYEATLAQAIDAVSAHLQAHFPRDAGTASTANELPDTPLVIG